ncbi:S-locus glycoprotein domain [Sesbania bispinosa]|nr:S-locus glycoprotein domain [Sesbania bispinosa]
MGFLNHTNYLLIALLIFSSFCLGLSSVNDTITSTRSIRDSETLSSNNSDFKLGFFSPENSSNRYVAIWYISESYIIWIANRDQPLKDSSGVFKIHKDGNLVIMNGQNHVIWSTNLSSTTNSSAKLDDSGNLILRDVTSGATIWDSFTHPCDAAVPQMKIGANRVTGKKIEYISRKSNSDPSTGYFTGSLERLDAPEVFFWLNKTQPYWRTGPWNGRVFLGAPRMLTEYLFGWRLDHDDDGTVYLTYSFADPSAFGILTLTPHGTLKLVRFLNKKEVLTLEVDQNECDFYGKCGPFGSCDNSTLPICSCFDGFEPRNSDEWSRKNWTSGCVRKAEAALQCEKLKNGSNVQQDGFLVFHNMKVPDFAERSDGNQDKCGTDCLANCSCLAYAYDSYVGCMYWSKDLIDLQKFPYGGVDLFIRVPAQLLITDQGKKERGNKALIIIAIAGGIGALTFAICAYLMWRKCTARPTGSQPQDLMIGDNRQIKLDELPLYGFEKLAIATNNFHLANKLGKGGFGTVYKGELDDGQEIAVKRLSKASGQGLEEFMNEVVVISKLQHRNLVRLLGCCVERDEQMLVYEFMPNKSLDAFLFDPLQKKVLDWRKRFNIIEGIARDFGLARIFKGGEDDEANTRRVVGTYGYMPPEYAMEGLFSEKSDVYSFGVLLLEIVSGRRNTSFHNNEESLSLVGFAWKLWMEEKIISLIDPEIWDPCFESSMLRCIHIGLLCVQELPKERPTIATVVLMLISEITHLPPPRQVAFVQKQKYQSSESSQKSQFSSNNNVTLSEIQGRAMPQEFGGTSLVLMNNNSRKTILFPILRQKHLATPLRRCHGKPFTKKDVQEIVVQFRRLSKDGRRKVGLKLECHMRSPPPRERKHAETQNSRELNLLGNYETPVVTLGGMENAAHTIIPITVLNNIIMNQQSLANLVADPELRRMLHEKCRSSDALFNLEPPLKEEILVAPYPTGYQPLSFRKFNGTGSALEHLMCFLDDLGVRRDDKGLLMKEFSKCIKSIEDGSQIYLSLEGIATFAELMRRGANVVEAMKNQGKRSKETEGVFDICTLEEIEKKRGFKSPQATKGFAQRDELPQLPINRQQACQLVEEWLKDGTLQVKYWTIRRRFQRQLKAGKVLLPEVEGGGGDLYRMPLPDHGVNVITSSDNGIRIEDVEEDTVIEEEMLTRGLAKTRGFRILFGQLGLDQNAQKEAAKALTKRASSQRIRVLPQLAALVETKGCVSAVLEVGPIRTINIFQVVDGDPSYHLLLGRPWIHLHQCIPSTLHQCIKSSFKGKEIKIPGVLDPFEASEAHLIDASLFDEVASPGSGRINNERYDMPKQQEDELEEVDISEHQGKKRPLFIGKDLKENEKESLLCLMREFRDVFAWDYDEMPGLSTKQHPTWLENIVPGVKEERTNKMLRRFHFGVSSEQFLRFKVHKEGISAKEKKVEAIKNLRPPTNIKETQQLIGKLGYIRCFILAMGELINPFRSQLKANDAFLWKQEHKSIVERIKQTMMSMQKADNCNQGQRAA